MVVREKWVGYGRIRGEKNGVKEGGLGFFYHRPSNGWGYGMVVRERWVGYGMIRGEKSGAEEGGGRLDVRGIEEGWVGAGEKGGRAW